VPTYEYHCEACGAFDTLRPMAERDAALACPGCGARARRVLFSAPALSSLSSEARKAHTVNERSSHAPRCGCASHQKSKNAGAQGFPGRRPWMISH